MSVFKLNEILATRPIVVNHLVSYLTKRKAFQEAHDLLEASGRYEEAALVAYNQVLHLNNIDDRVRRIKNLLQTSVHFHRHPDANHLIETSITTVI